MMISSVKSTTCTLFDKLAHLLFFIFCLFSCFDQLDHTEIMLGAIITQEKGENIGGKFVSGRGEMALFWF